VAQWSLTSLRDKVVKTGTKVVAYGAGRPSVGRREGPAVRVSTILDALDDPHLLAARRLVFRERAGEPTCETEIGSEVGRKYEPPPVALLLDLGTREHPRAATHTPLSPTRQHMSGPP
jgi:hypothetical protein